MLLPPVRLHENEEKVLRLRRRILLPDRLEEVFLSLLDSFQSFSQMVAGSRETTPSNSRHASPIRLSTNGKSPSASPLNGIYSDNNDSFHQEQLPDEVDDDDDNENDDDDDNNDPSSTTASLVTTVCCCYSWLEYMWDAFGMPKIYQLLANWKILTYGQILSFMLAAGGAAQSALYVNCHLNTPTTFTLAFVYFFLSLHMIPIYFSFKSQATMTLVPSSDDDNDNNIPPSQIHSNVVSGNEEQFDGSTLSRRSLLEGPAWAYLAMAVLDVEANYFTVLAFQYTTLTSVTLFDALAIPSSMILSRMFLQRHYTNFHMLGVLLCMIGVLVNVFQDYDSDNGGDIAANAAADNEMIFNATAAANKNDGAQVLPHKLRGDILAITGGILYGFNDFLCELSVRHLGGPEEFLGMMGFFALIVSAIQAYVIERHQITAFWHAIVHQHHDNNRYLIPDDVMPNDSTNNAVCSGTIISMVWVFYVVISVFGYIGAARFLTISEAAFYNLSLLTGDLWSVAFSIVDERILPQPLFYLALFLITGGVLLYETAPSPIQEEHQTAEQQEVSTTSASRRKREKRKTSMLRLIDTSFKDEDENGDVELQSSARRINHLREVA